AVQGKWATGSFDFDPARIKKMYQEKFEKGKKVAEDLARKTKEESQPEVSQKQAGTGQKTSSVLMDRLRDLNELRKEGIITEEEFEQMKKRLLESI
ncbi:MAG: SHOCT domain-containing protein, partial [Saprospiraceae bacterium]|nr:SHOCT domain-containing protein [Saprospiraceae bacterium]